MRKTILVIAAAAVMLIPQVSQAAPAFGARSHVVSPEIASEVGYRRHYRRYPARLYVRGYHRGYGPYSAYAADPSFGYYPTLRNFQRQGRCVQDLGYGRFEVCD